MLRRLQKPSSHDYHSHGARRKLLAIGFAVVLVRAAAIDVFAEPPVPVPAWTTDLSEMKVPDPSVSGMVPLAAGSRRTRLSCGILDSSCSTAGKSLAISASPLVGYKKGPIYSKGRRTGADRGVMIVAGGLSVRFASPKTRVRVLSARRTTTP